MPRRLELVGILVLVGCVVCSVALLIPFGKREPHGCNACRRTMIHNLRQALREYETDQTYLDDDPFKRGP